METVSCMVDLMEAPVNPPTIFISLFGWSSSRVCLTVPVEACATLQVPETEVQVTTHDEGQLEDHSPQMPCDSDIYNDSLLC